jgi:hypothetical protein
MTIAERVYQRADIIDCVTNSSIYNIEMKPLSLEKVPSYRIMDLSEEDSQFVKALFGSSFHGE